MHIAAIRRSMLLNFARNLLTSVKSVWDQYGNKGNSRLLRTVFCIGGRKGKMFVRFLSSWDSFIIMLLVSRRNRRSRKTSSRVQNLEYDAAALYDLKTFFSIFSSRFALPHVLCVSYCCYNNAFLPTNYDVLKYCAKVVLR